jgi:hypothetical protein
VAFVWAQLFVNNKNMKMQILGEINRFSEAMHYFALYCWFRVQVAIVVQKTMLIIPQAKFDVSGNETASPFFLFLRIIAVPNPTIS